MVVVVLEDDAAFVGAGGEESVGVVGVCDVGVDGGQDRERAACGGRILECGEERAAEAVGGGERIAAVGFTWRGGVDGRAVLNL